MLSHPGPRAGALVLALSLAFLVGAAEAAPLSTAFTYQGELNQSGSPLNGSADFQFSLFDAGSAGTQVGLTLTLNNVQVSGGVFAALLDFGVDVFNGQARYLQISVRAPSGAGGFTTLSPRVAVTPTPYALQTRGIFVDSNENVTIGSYVPGPQAFQPYQPSPGAADKLKVWAHGPGDTAVDGESDATSGPSDGVHGKSASSEGRGVVGEVTATSGETKGMHGKAASAQGTGVLGEASATTGNAMGVHGTSAAAGGKGIMGEATGDASSRGVEGKSTNGEGVHGEGATGMHGMSSTAGGKGILGEANADANSHGVEGKSTNGVGVHGEGATGMHGMSTTAGGKGILGEADADAGSHGVEGKSANGEGVHGEGATGMHGKSAASNGEGVLGEATATSGANIGVHGKTSSPSGYAGYFDGRAYISDRLGVGTNAPTAMLHVGGTPGTDGIRFPDGTLQTTATPPGASSWQSDGSNLFYNNGRLGVGTNTPAARIAAVEATGIAIHGAASGTGGKGVQGQATGTGGSIGVEGLSTSGEGVRGQGIMGMHGVSTSSGGVGVQGDGGAGGLGVNGVSSGGVGVQGYVTGTGGIGVIGQSQAPNGIGLRGDGGLRGVIGVAHSAASDGMLGFIGPVDPTTITPGGAGVFGRSDDFGSTKVFGVRGSSNSTAAKSAGVFAEGNGVLANGSPQAAALALNNGAVLVTGTVRPAGIMSFDAHDVLWTSIVSCDASSGTSHTHTLGYKATISLANPLITDTSIILLTVQAGGVSGGELYTAFVRGQGTGGGQASIDVSKLGNAPGVCVEPSGTIRLHYFVINADTQTP